MEPKRIVEEIIYNVERSSYDTFMNNLCDRLADNNDYRVFTSTRTTDIRGYLLCELIPEQPSRWMDIKLVGDNNETTTLAIRADNLYLKGFKNKEGVWYEFGFSGKVEPNENKRTNRMIPGSTFLECNDKYRDIVNASVTDKKSEVKRRLVGLELGQGLARDAVRRLSGYAAPPETIVDPVTRLALGRLILMICESARMTPFFRTVRNVWPVSTSNVKITRKLVDYLWNWGNMSRVVLHGCTESLEEVRRIGIRNRDDALKVVYLLLNSPPKTKRMRAAADVYDDAHGRPLVELFAVRADFGAATATAIAVFDGKRGQIIYQQGQGLPLIGSSQPQVGSDLVLTGPYTAISADGSFSIRVRDIPATDASDGSAGNVVRRMLWDCYADNAQDEYDRLLTRGFSTPGGETVEGLEVDFAVLRNAVEATVQVDLLLNKAADREVYGRVTARSDFFSDQPRGRVWLFERPPQQNGLAVSSAGAGSFVPIPLARSVLAVPIGHLLKIEVKLEVVIPNQGDNITFQNNLEFRTFRGRAEESFHNEHGIVRVKIAWSEDEDAEEEIEWID